MLTRLSASESKLVADNYRLVPHFVRQLTKNRQDLKPHFDDLCQEAYFGLMKAAQTYDPGKAAFSHWAKQWITSYLQEALRKTKARGFTYAPRETKPVCFDIDAAKTFNPDYDGKYEYPPVVATLGTNSTFPACEARIDVERAEAELGRRAAKVRGSARKKQTKRDVAIFFEVALGEETQVQIASDYDCSRQNVSKIVLQTTNTLRTWATGVKESVGDQSAESHLSR